MKAKKEEILNVHSMQELSMEEMVQVNGGGLFNGIRLLEKKIIKEIIKIKDVF